MKYINNYKKFINESKQQIDKNAAVVEKQMFKDFSKDFWGLCVNSSIFTNEEKVFINENLKQRKVNLLKEEWGWLNKAITWAKETGEKTLKYITDKISKIRKGISNFVGDMIKFAKNILVSLIKGAIRAGNDFANKQKETIKKEFEKADKKILSGELSQLSQTLAHWGVVSLETGKNLTTSAIKFGDEVVNQIGNKISTSTETATSELSKNLEEVEGSESKNESIFNTKDDVLLHFYNMGKVNESEDNKEGDKEKKGTGSLVFDFILSFIGQEKIDPEAKTGKKLFWWGKLILKLISTCLSPVLKAIEFAIKLGAKGVLQAVSALTKSIGGPGFYKFVLLSGITAGLVGLVVDAAMMTKAITGNDTFLGKSYKDLTSVKAWLAGILSHAAEFMPGKDLIKILLTGFCLLMTCWHVAEEFGHLAHSSHSDGGH
jgi:hypothetical protein